MGSTRKTCPPRRRARRRNSGWSSLPEHRSPPEVPLWTLLLHVTTRRAERFEEPGPHRPLRQTLQFVRQGEANMHVWALRENIKVGHCVPPSPSLCNAYVAPILNVIS